MHPYQSSDMTEAEFLTGKKGTPVMLAGHLRMPRMMGKQPVVVLLHGAAGVGPAKHIVGAWADVLNEAGIGVFIADSWSGRGLTQISTDITRVSEMSRMNDVLGALVLLQKHPLVDPAKIAVLGSSHGGPAALFLALKRFEKYYKSDVRFAAHISVSGACNTTYRGNEDFVKPVLMLHGSADDWVPAAPCREYADRLAKAGKNVRYIEYPDAHHAFDSPMFSKAITIPQGMTTRGCTLAESDSGAILNTAGQPFGGSDPCIQRGATVHYHEAAAKKAHADVLAFLKDVFEQK